MNEKELERLWASVSPLVEKMKAKYPKELNLDGLEPALTHDICMIVNERDEKLKEKIRYMKYPQPLLGTPLHTEERMNTINEIIDDIINLIDNHD